MPVCGGDLVNWTDPSGVFSCEETFAHYSYAEGDGTIVTVSVFDGFPLAAEGLAIRTTTSLARFSGRAVPVVGWELAAYDAVSIAVCTVSGE